MTDNMATWGEANNNSQLLSNHMHKTLSHHMGAGFDIAGLVAAILPVLVQIAPSILNAWSGSATSSATNKINQIVSVLPSPSLNQLMQVGATLFPDLAPEFHAVAAAQVLSNPSPTMWVQEALNYAASRKFITYPAQPGYPLDVDGIYGSRTKNAIMLVQAAAHIKVTGFLADAEAILLGGLLAKIG